MGAASSGGLARGLTGYRRARAAFAGRERASPRGSRARPSPDVSMRNLAGRGQVRGLVGWVGTALVECGRAHGRGELGNIEEEETGKI